MSRIQLKGSCSQVFKSHSILSLSKVCTQHEPLRHLMPCTRSMPHMLHDLAPPQAPLLLQKDYVVQNVFNLHKRYRRDPLKSMDKTSATDEESEDGTLLRNDSSILSKL